MGHSLRGPTVRGIPSAPRWRPISRNSRSAGFTVVRTYTAPPPDVVEAAGNHGLRLLAGVFYSDWRYLMHGSPRELRRVVAGAEREVRDAAHRYAGDPRILAVSLGNEVPADVLRWVGTHVVADTIRKLTKVVHDEDPGQLVTYANYPTAEYLPLECLDFLTFNVFLEKQNDLRRYLTRLHHLAGDRPLVLGEMGIDCRRDSGGRGRAGGRARLAVRHRDRPRRRRNVRVLVHRRVVGRRRRRSKAGTSASPGPTDLLAERSTSPDRWNGRDGTQTSIGTWPSHQRRRVRLQRGGDDRRVPSAHLRTRLPGARGHRRRRRVDRRTPPPSPPASRVRLVHDPPRRAVRRPQRGLRAADGEIVAFLDSDAYRRRSGPTPRARLRRAERRRRRRAKRAAPGRSSRRAASSPAPPVGPSTCCSPTTGPSTSPAATWRSGRACSPRSADSTRSTPPPATTWTSAGASATAHGRSGSTLPRWCGTTGARALRPTSASNGATDELEALVEARHPDRFTAVGTARWRGRIYDSSGADDRSPAGVPRSVRNRRVPVRLPSRWARPSTSCTGRGPLVAARVAHRAPRAPHPVVGASGRGRRAPDRQPRRPRPRPVDRPAAGRWTRPRVPGARRVARTWCSQSFARGHRLNRAVARKELLPDAELPEPTRRSRGGGVMVPEDRSRDELAAATINELTASRSRRAHVHRLGRLRARLSLAHRLR